ncbi:Gag-Pol polyprotein [Gossypium australe]|uniref:Gag-Pol polyprotein n=1 Tax=Gossypium australe TaxID=47621 RepID=A0A5B6WUG6_9ROSI|nr:Gag-Pol polyprotein [Gossypium australe]
MDPDRDVVDDVESNALAPTQGAAPSKSRLVTVSQGGEAREAFFQMMKEWFAEFIQKQWAEEFRANVDDDPERAEFRLENSIRKRKEFLELKQNRMSVTEYKREFVRLNKYARECVSTEAIMYKRFEDGLEEDIRLLVGILELKELC